MLTKVDFTIKRKEDGKEFEAIIGTANSTTTIPRFYIGKKENRNKGWLVEIIDGMEKFYDKYEVIAIG